VAIFVRSGTIIDSFDKVGRRIDTCDIYKMSRRVKREPAPTWCPKWDLVLVCSLGNPTAVPHSRFRLVALRTRISPGLPLSLSGPPLDGELTLPIGPRPPKVDEEMTEIPPRARTGWPDRRGVSKVLHGTALPH